MIDGRDLVRKYADRLNSRFLGESENVCTAERAYGMAQRELMEQGIELTMDERIALTAYAHGYVTAKTGVKEKRQSKEIDSKKFKLHHKAGVEDGS